MTIDTKYMIATVGTLASAAAGAEGLYIQQESTLDFERQIQSACCGLGNQLRALERLTFECSTRGWDGEDAAPVSKRGREVAFHFLLMLPPHGLVEPTIGIDADGMITVEWYSGPKNLLSVSIGSDATLHYASVLGTATQYGSETFNGVVSPRILDLIARVNSARLSV